ncbi:YicC/YloC family endoribonuclease [Rhodobacter sp. TJ_12]|uniref:YicC/YloC family endoribonuclease n=1 Tax=Rhodobacter sp. TJ_12 TaxID=2029399 RepID=UPI001CC183AD|nr:YicC/YloC family endoribonuclease [Rhodobacter sp. TJ_12]
MVKSSASPRPQNGPLSMTGFASIRGSGLGFDWSWEIRSVNGKGLDLRLRLPELEGLEAQARAAVSRAATRGNIQLNLKLTPTSGDEKLRLSEPALGAALTALQQVEEAAARHGVTLAPTRASDLLAVRGVIEQGGAELADPAPLRSRLLADLDTLLDSFVAMRAAEGGQLYGVIVAQLDRIAQLTESAAEVAEARRPEMATNLRAALARVMEGAAGADPQRVAQELALLSVKADVTEEIDRLRAHVAAARGLLAEQAPVGRKFDFLTQEFVREANTLCSKSGSTALTAIGLDLKHVIDQMREQIQNVE